ncbi:MAG: N-acetylmuramoyl-L-alanine amidase [Bacillota bacterium]
MTWVNADMAPDDRRPLWSHIIVHHTGAEEKDAAQVRAYHLSLGWRDVGYHFLIERSGAVVAGRPLGLPGAHCTAAGMNRRAIGVALIGNFEAHPPLAAQLAALVELLRHLAAAHGIPAANILGHREVPGAATLCPGRYLDMGEVRRRVDNALQGMCGPGGTPPQAASSPSNITPCTSRLRLYRVQVGAFRDRENAERLAARLRAMGFDAMVVNN